MALAEIGGDILAAREDFAVTGEDTRLFKPAHGAKVARNRGDNVGHGEVPHRSFMAAPAVQTGAGHLNTAVRRPAGFPPKGLVWPTRYPATRIWEAVFGQHPLTEGVFSTIAKMLPFSRSVKSCDYRNIIATSTTDFFAVLNDVFCCDANHCRLILMHEGADKLSALIGSQRCLHSVSFDSTCAINNERQVNSCVGLVGVAGRLFTHAHEIGPSFCVIGNRLVLRCRLAC